MSWKRHGRQSQVIMNKQKRLIFGIKQLKRQGLTYQQIGDVIRQVYAKLEKETVISSAPSSIVVYESWWKKLIQWFKNKFRRDGVEIWI